MSANTLPVSELVSEDWQLVDEDAKRPLSLFVQLRRRAHILPWHQFLHAEGDHSQVRIAFASHVVIVTGHGLAALLEALATQSVVRLVQPTENEALLGFRGLKATKITGAAITEMTVVRAEDEEEE